MNPPPVSSSHLNSVSVKPAAAHKCLEGEKIDVSPRDPKRSELPVMKRAKFPHHCVAAA
jgi:hypothetical protein